MNPLTPEEKHVIIDKGTEMPFSGKYYQHAETGTYICRQCGAELYRSYDKFDAHCGWPSFDQAVPGSVVETEDNSLGMSRVEITCSKCGSHLGHVFPDGPTDTGKRYCLNSICLI